MTYQVTLTVESSLCPASIAREIGAALGAWGIESSKVSAESDIERQLKETVAEDRRCGEEFVKRITKAVDDCVNK